MARVVLKDPYRWFKLWYETKLAARRKIRHGIFSAIERGDVTEALHLGTKATLLRARGEFGASPLVAAISSGHTDLASEFIVRGGMFAGDGSIAHAAMRGDIAVVEMLLRAHKCPDEPLPRSKELSYQGYTPLMWASRRKHIEVARALLRAGADVNAVSEDGTTAVMCTVDTHPASLEVLELLCSYRPDITKKDWRGRDLIREAQDRQNNSGKPQMLQILQRHFPEMALPGPCAGPGGMRPGSAIPKVSTKPPRKLNVQQQNARTESSLRKEATYWRVHGVPDALARLGLERGVQWEKSIILSLDIDFPGMPTLFGVLLSQDLRFVAFELDTVDDEVRLVRWEDTTEKQNFNKHNPGTGVGYGALALKVLRELNA